MRFFVFLLGLAVGSFLNVVIDRFPKGEDIIWKPSHCDFCKKKLRWYELIPVASFIIQRGRCLRCRRRLSLRYPIVELTAAVGLLYVYPHYILFLIFSVLLVLFMIDFRDMILPDGLLLVLLFLILVTGSWDLVSALSSGGAFLLLWLGTRGKGLGFGDVKLVTLLGLFLGYPLVVISLYIAFLTGALYGVILMVRKRAGFRSRIAFGPFLILGWVAAFLFGDAIWKLWLGILV